MLKMKYRIYIVLILFLITLPISGCWDRKEIENRGYVLGVAIDYALPEQAKKQYDLQYAPQSVGERKYRVTFELPKFRKPQGGEEPSKAASHLLWAAEGESMSAAAQAVNTKIYFRLFFEDMQSIIFSEAVARDGIMDILDFFQRDVEMRRRVKLFVTPMRAEDIFKAQLQVEEVNSIFISKIMANAGNYPYFASKSELGQLSKALRGKRSFAIPIVVSQGEEVQLKKAAIFNKDAKMIGELNELEVIGGKILRNNITGGVIIAPNPANPTKIIAFEIYEIDIKIIPKLENDQLRFLLKARFIGTIGENMEPKQNALSPAFLTEAEYAVAQEITRLIHSGYAKQQDLKAEVCELGDLIHRNYPQYWKQIKDRWDDEIFPTVPLDVNVEIMIRRSDIKK